MGEGVAELRPALERIKVNLQRDIKSDAGSVVPRIGATEVVLVRENGAGKIVNML